MLLITSIKISGKKESAIPVIDRSAFGDMETSHIVRLKVPAMLIPYSIFTDPGPLLIYFPSRYRQITAKTPMAIFSIPIPRNRFLTGTILSGTSEST